MLTLDLREFEVDLDKFEAEDVPKALVALQMKVALEVLKGVVLMTPVGNPTLWAPQSLPAPKGYTGGQARGNWQVGIGTAPEGDTGRIDKGGGETINAGVSMIQGAKAFATIWVVNNLPYIVALEDGWSKQAPRGMVKLTVANVEAAFGVGG